MSKHLFGIVVTHHGTAANNRGETEGNITTLQKLLWHGEVHTTMSAESIRYAIRWYWQRSLDQKSKLNRSWDDKANAHTWTLPNFTEQSCSSFVDDDVMGFMSAKAGAEESNDAEAGQKKKRTRGTCDKRRARLEITRAISLTPFAGDITFNAASVGATPSASSTGKDPVPYGTEIHATRYQYGFALTPEELADKSRALLVLDAIANLNEVAGNHARFLFDYSPESIILRWTDDFAPRMLYGFALSADGKLAAPDVVARVKSGDIRADELIIGGSLAEHEDVKALGVKLCPGVKAAVKEAKTRLSNDLGLTK